MFGSKSKYIKDLENITKMQNDQIEDLIELCNHYRKIASDSNELSNNLMNLIEKYCPELWNRLDVELKKIKNT